MNTMQPLLLYAFEIYEKNPRGQCLIMDYTLQNTVPGLMHLYNKHRKHKYTISHHTIH